MPTILDLCSCDLTAMGFTVRRFDSPGCSHTVVWIDHTPRCDRLGGTHYVRQDRVAVTEACKGRWTEMVKARSECP